MLTEFVKTIVPPFTCSRCACRCVRRTLDAFDTGSLCYECWFETTASVTNIHSFTIIDRDTEGQPRVWAALTRFGALGLAWMLCDSNGRRTMLTVDEFRQRFAHA